MKRVYLVRHGETLCNLAQTVQDGSDVLSPNGHIQASILADRIQTLPPARLITSDYTRALETTAAIVQKTGLLPSVTPLLREVRRPTEFIGRTRDDLSYLNFLDQSFTYMADPAWHYSDEENFYDVRDRVEALFEYFDQSQEDVIAVTHGRFIMFLVSYVLLDRQLSAGIWKLCMHTFVTYNTGITVIEYAKQLDHWRLVTFNDHAHFADN